MNLLSVKILGLLIFTLPHFLDGRLTEKVSVKMCLLVHDTAESGRWVWKLQNSTMLVLLYKVLNN